MGSVGFSGEDEERLALQRMGRLGEEGKMVQSCMQLVVSANEGLAGPLAREGIMEACAIGSRGAGRCY